MKVAKISEAFLGSVVEFIIARVLLQWNRFFHPCIFNYFLKYFLFKIQVHLLEQQTFYSLESLTNRIKFYVTR